MQIPGLQNTSMIGVALDGFPIFAKTDGNGNVVTEQDLDVCGGKVRFNSDQKSWI